jgi:hypothetical protein
MFFNELTVTHQAFFRTQTVIANALAKPWFSTQQPLVFSSFFWHAGHASGQKPDVARA